MGAGVMCGRHKWMLISCTVYLKSTIISRVYHLFERLYEGPDTLIYTIFFSSQIVVMIVSELQSQLGDI